MGIVAEDAVNQFEALMNQGPLLRSFSLRFFFRWYFPSQTPHFAFIFGSWRVSEENIPGSPFSPLLRSVLLLGQFVFFPPVYDYILYIIYYVLLDFCLLGEMNLQVINWFPLWKLYFSACVYEFSYFWETCKAGFLFDLLNCLFGGLLGIWQLRCGVLILI